MAYPNVERWSALQDGRRVPVDDGARHYLMSVVDCGFLVMPTGRLVACGPYFGLQDSGDGFFQVPPGRYRVLATLADVSDANDGSHIRVAYASLMLDEAAYEATRRIIVPPVEGVTCPPEMGDDNVFRGFGVDAGTACFVDDGAIADSLRQEFWELVFDNGRRDGGLSLLNSVQHLRKGLANFPLPHAPGGGNMIAFHSGWRDGRYSWFPVVGGYDASGRLVRLHIDFFVVPPGERGEPFKPSAQEPHPQPYASETATYPVLPLRDIVVMPGMIIPLFIGRERSVGAVDKAMRDGTYILLATQKDRHDDDPAPDAIYSVGTLGIVFQTLNLQDGTRKALIEGFGRAEVLHWSVRPDCFQAETVMLAGATDEDSAALARSVLDTFATYVEIRDREIEKEEGETEPFVDIEKFKDLTDPGVLADQITSYVTVPIPDKQAILETTAVSERLRKLLALLQREIALRAR
jgi:Lon protease-like protein